MGYTTISDVYQDYSDMATSAGVAEDDLLDIDKVRDIVHALGGVYEDLDRDLLIRALLLATSDEFWQVMF